MTASRAGGLTFIWCNNDDPARPAWSPGRDVVARRNGRTYFFWRIDGPPWTWSGPSPIAVDPPHAVPPLRRANTLERRLASCQDLRNSIVRETGAGVRVPYDDWTRAHKDQLNELCGTQDRRGRLPIDARHRFMDGYVKEMHATWRATLYFRP